MIKSFYKSTRICAKGEQCRVAGSLSASHNGIHSLCFAFLLYFVSSKWFKTTATYSLEKEVFCSR